MGYGTGIDLTALGQRLGGRAAEAARAYPLHSCCSSCPNGPHPPWGFLLGGFGNLQLAQGIGVVLHSVGRRGDREGHPVGPHLLENLICLQPNCLVCWDRHRAEGRCMALPPHGATEPAWVVGLTRPGSRAHSLIPSRLLWFCAHFKHHEQPEVLVQPLLGQVALASLTHSTLVNAPRWWGRGILPAASMGKWGEGFP